MGDENAHGDCDLELDDCNAEVDVDERTELDHDPNVRTRVHVWNKKYILVITLVILTLILGCVGAVLYSYSPDEANTKPWTNMRLPRSIIPHSYDLGLDINMGDDSYKGNVVIHLFVAEETEWILLHKVELKITSVVIYYNERKIGVVKELFYELNEIYALKASQPLKKGHSYRVGIQFSGKMRSDLSGLYTSFYNYEGNKTRKVASTFFSPISARKAFPCFDEPVFKANFTITLTHSDKYHALSNMARKSTLKKDNLVTTKFYTSIKMSTYLVAWVISDFGYITKDNSSKPLMRVWGQKEKLSDLKYSLETTSKLLRFYEKYFNISYPLKELDTVAIPNLAPGAMENWGIITYRSQIILFNQNKSTAENKQDAFNIIAHELVHQWFGNLVTMEYWTDAWLKEGFANNIAIIGGDRVDKSMELRKRVLTNLMLPAMDTDSYSSSHPISTSVKTPSDVRGVFNVITYNKGSCLVEIIHQFLGVNHFRKGLQKYLKVYSYKNANQDNLWKELSDVSGKDVKSVMDTWTLQLGYPVVSARRINDTSLQINQKRFSLDTTDTSLPKSPFNYIWKIPIVIKNPMNNKRKSYLLEKTTAVIHIPSEYSIINPDHSLFYRVHYDKDMLETVKTILMKNRNLLSAQDRTGLISDQFNFVSAERTDIGSTLDIIKYLKDETDFSPWKVAFESFKRIHSLIEDNNIRSKFDLFVKSISTGIIQNMTWANPKSTNEGSLQILLLEQACQPGVAQKHTDKIKEACDLYENYMDINHMNVRPSLYPVVLYCAISQGPVRYWEYAFRRYREGGVLKDSFLMALTTSTNTSIIKKLLDFSLDDNIIETQDAPHVIGHIATRSNTARKICWEFVKKNWFTIIERYGNELFLLSQLIEPVLENFSTEKDLNEITTFFKDKTLGSAQYAYDQVLNKIHSNIRWKKKHLGDLSKWLTSQGF